MLPYRRYGDHGPLLVLLHWLTGSGFAWHEVGKILRKRGAQCIAIDLPGFGDANSISGYEVRAMSTAVVETVRMLRSSVAEEPWLIGGHSMGGKVATVVARDAINGADGLSGLRGAVLVSPSPPSREPMEERKRAEMLKQLGESTGDADQDRKLAGKFIDDNTGKLPLRTDVRERAVTDVLSMNRTAFRAWLEQGSKEDWSERVGRLPLPAMILAGSEEAALGPDIQREKSLPHFVDGDVIPLEGCGHLAPLERPFEVAEHICSFMSTLGLPLKAQASELGQSFATLLESNRVSMQTRSVLESRMISAATWDHKPKALSGEAFRTMRALAERVVPHAGFDVAGSIEQRLASATGDGWRFATLPSDVEAWRKGIASLDAAAKRGFYVSFIALHPEQQDDLLRKVSEGEIGKGLLGSVHVGASADAYSGSEMKQWFEEVRGEFAKCYMAHPSTMERVGFTGFADEGGFTQIQIGQREVFER